ncbi:hypothetical protein XENTR_v10022960 [Xenopus tropicalis]|nr:hypothetical protein XENTR_v10022960 [Xenopus tropicalis]
MSANQDGSFNVTSTCEHLRDKVSGNEPFSLRATVQHARLKQAVCKEWNSDNEEYQKSKPQVIQPIKLSISASGEVLCSLFVLSFYPKEIPITWSYGSGQSQETKPSEEKYKGNGDGTYDMESTCTVPGSLFNDPEFRVKVKWKHEAMDEEESREMSLRDPDFPWRPTIEEISRFIWIRDQPTNLRCKVSPYFPDALTVSWMEKRKGRDPQVIPVSKYGKYQIPDMAPERRNDNTYTYTAQLSLPPSSRVEEDLEFICRVEHPSLERPIERSTGTRQFKAAPKQPIPVQWSLSDTGEALCTLSLQNFYPKPIELTWTCLTGSQQTNLHSEPQYQNNSDQTFNVTSSCSVPENLLRLPDCKVRVTWNHPATGASESSEICPRDPGFPWRPQVAVQPIPTLTQGREVTLQWDISGYFPNALTVTWALRKTGHEEPISPPHTQNYRAENKPGRAPCGTYISTEYLPFIPSILSHQGAEIVCRVAHPSLAQPIEIGTGALQITVAPGAPEPVRFSISDSGKGIVCSLTVRGFYPKDIHIEWAGTRSHKHPREIIPSQKVIQVNDDETFTAVSEATIPLNSLSLPVTVTWNHKPTGQTGNAEIHPHDFPWRPVMAEILTPDLYVGTEAEILCPISGYFPDKLTVTWYKEKESGREELVNNGGRYKIPDIQSQEQTGWTLTCTARLAFSPSIAEDGAEFICRVVHPSLKEAIERRTKPLYVRARPTVGEIQLREDGKFYLVADGFYPEQMKISWQLIQEQARNKGKEQAGNKGKALSSEPEYGNNPDGTYRATSACQIPTGINRNIPYTLCATVAHESLPQPIVTHIKQVAPGAPEPVRFSISDSGKGIVCSLTVRGFYPKDIHIEWAGTRSHKHPREIIPSQKVIQVNDDETFTAVSEATIPLNSLSLPVTVTWNHKPTGQTGNAEIHPHGKGSV